jgi:hypothetical protein
VGFLGCIVCLVVWLAPRIALAEQIAIMLVVEPSKGTEDVRDRAEDELRAAGFVVTGDAEAAVAIIKLSRRAADAEGAEWTIAVEDRITVKRIERASRVARGEDENERIALLAVELLYASWLELEIAAPRAGSVPPPAAVTHEVRRRLTEPLAPPRWGLHGGMALLVAGGPLGQLPALQLGASWLRDSLRLELDAWLTPATTVSHEDASARVRLASLRLQALFQPFANHRLVPAFGVGAGFLVVSADGEARAPLEAASETGVAGMGAVCALLTYHVTAAIRVRAAGVAALAVPELRVRFAGEEVLSVGRPLAELDLGVEWAFR